MRKPREILIQRHQHVAGKLDQIRQQVLAGDLGVNGAATKPSMERWSLAVWIGRAWTELFWAGRRAWGGLAVVWVIILTLNWNVSDQPAKVTDGLPPSGTSVFRILQEQQRLAAELVESDAPVPAEPSPHRSPARSERAEPTAQLV